MNRRQLACAEQAEAVHAKLCAMALAAVTQDQEPVETKVFLCPACDHMEAGEPPSSCPWCGVPDTEFVRL